MTVKKWQLGYDEATGNFVELGGETGLIAAPDNDPRVIAFENQITAIMEQKGLTADQAGDYVQQAYSQGTTIDALQWASDQTGYADERGDMWGSGGGSQFLTDQAARTDEIALQQGGYGNSAENAEQLINQLYTEGFGREADEDGLAYWSNELTSGNMTYAQIAGAFGASEEASIRDDYHELFGRDVDDSGLQYWLQDDTHYSIDQLTGSTEQDIRDEYADSLGQFSSEEERQANMEAGGFWTDAQEGGYANLNWSQYKQGDADLYNPDGTWKGTDVQQAGDTFEYNFGSDDDDHELYGTDQETSSFMYGDQYEGEFETTLTTGTGLDTGENKTGVEHYRAAVDDEDYTATSSFTGNTISTVDDVRQILQRREDIMNTTSTYDVDDSEGGTGIGRIFTLEEMEPWLSSATSLRNLADRLGPTKWDLLTKELDKTFKTFNEADYTGNVLFDPGHNPDQRGTNRTTISNKYKVPVPDDYESPNLANVTRQDVDYMPDLDGTVSDRPLQDLDSSKADEQWLNQVYQNTLSRDIEQPGRDYWGGELAAGQSRDSIRSNIGISNEAWLNQTYQKHLGRNLGDEGRTYWGNELKQGASKESVEANIIASNEYKDVRNQRKWVAGTNAQGVRRRQSSAARSGRSAMGTKQLARNNMQIKSLNI